MNNRLRRMPSKMQIHNYWYRGEGKGVLEHHDIELDPPEKLSKKSMFTCLACGIGSPAKIERAHIQAKSSGGSDEVANLHLLCSGCHQQSEFYDGDVYWRWLKAKSENDYKDWLEHTVERWELLGFEFITFSKTLEENGLEAAVEYVSKFTLNGLSETKKIELLRALKAIQDER